MNRINNIMDKYAEARINNRILEKEFCLIELISLYFNGIEREKIFDKGYSDVSILDLVETLLKDCIENRMSKGLAEEYIRVGIENTLNISLRRF